MAPTTIRTARLDVRLLTLDDAEAFHGIWGDPVVIWWGAHETVEQTRQFLAQLLARVEGRTGHGWFGMFDDDGVLVGDVVVQPAPWDRGIVEIGWHTARAAQGRGYATEAMRAVLDQARACGIGYVEAVIVPHNTASRRVAEKLGMRVVGERIHSGMVHDLWALELD